MLLPFSHFQQSGQATRRRRNALSSVTCFVLLCSTLSVASHLSFALVRVCPVVAQKIYWSFSRQINETYTCAKQVKATIWLANDWTTLPLAARLAREQVGFMVMTRTNLPPKNTAKGGVGVSGIDPWSMPSNASSSATRL